MAKNREEEVNQVALVQWFRRQYPKYADLLTLASIGENVGPRRMARLKQMGLTPGYPDLMLCLAKDGDFYEGRPSILFIEMKTKKGRVQPNQTAIHNQLRERHYQVEVARSWEEAKEIIQNYISA